MITKKEILLHVKLSFCLCLVRMSCNRAKASLRGFLSWLQSNPEPTLRELIGVNQVSVEMGTDKPVGTYPMIGNNPALSDSLTTGNCTNTEPINRTVAEDYPLSARGIIISF